jgi:hypothetical protein
VASQHIYSNHAATGECAGSLWTALRAAGEPRTVAELHGSSRAHPTAIRNRLARWQRCGFVTVEEPQPPRYRIHPEAVHLVEPPAPGSLADIVWAALRRIGRPATVAELVAATGASDRAVYCRINRWWDQCFVQRVPGVPRRYALAPNAPEGTAPPPVSGAGLVVAPRPRGARARMWTAIRVMRTFDVPALIMTAEVTRRACDEFLNLLVRAGYVRCTHNFKDRSGQLPTRDWSTYQLLRNTGPKHPTFSKFKGKTAARFLTDHNNGTSVELASRVPPRARGGNHVS